MAKNGTIESCHRWQRWGLTLNARAELEVLTSGLPLLEIPLLEIPLLEILMLERD